MSGDVWSMELSGDVGISMAGVYLELRHQIGFYGVFRHGQVLLELWRRRSKNWIELLCDRRLHQNSTLPQ
jgi:hypothetical protein